MSASDAPFGSLPPAALAGLPAEIAKLQSLAEERRGHDPSLWLYRDRTAALIRRYGRLAVEVGRLPSLLGREFFRGRVSSYRVGTFEDAVIFVHDVERALEHLDELDKKVLARMVLQDFTQDETAALLGCGRRTVVRRLPEALDRLSEIFLVGGLLKYLPEPAREKSCQEGVSGENSLSDCEHGE